MGAEGKEIRGWLLNIVDRAKPYGASFKVIEHTVADMGFHVSENEIKAHLKYLLQKGYTSLKEMDHMGIKRSLNFITAKGMDLKEGNIPPDPGVMLFD